MENSKEELEKEQDITKLLTDIELNELFEAVYLNVATHKFPSFTEIYEPFCEAWILSVGDFLRTNMYVYKISQEELENIEENLDKYGFKMPDIDEFMSLIYPYAYVEGELKTRRGVW